MAATEGPPPAGALRNVPGGVWALGFVSAFMDVSSEMIHALLPLYLVNVIGVSTLMVGFIEGGAEATAMITRIFSGALSDWLGKRKPLAVIGYGLAAVTKPVFALATGIGWLVAARFVDRVGKGIRGAPRDALIADLAPDHLRGASFGLRQSLDTVGAFVGPLAAMGLMMVTADSYTTVFWIAVLPAFVSVGVLVLAVREPAQQPAPQTAAAAAQRPRLWDLKRFPAAFWAVAAVAAVLTLARFSEAFLILRAQDVGLAAALAPAVLVAMNVIYALSSYPAGALSDRIGRRTVLVAGIGAIILADLVLAYGGGVGPILLGVALWGLHMGLTQGLLAALVADTAPEELRGTAFGVFNFIGGFALLAASVIAGALWQAYGPQAAFLAGAGFAALGMLGLAWIGSGQRKHCSG